MLLLITVALVLLFCSYRKRSYAGTVPSDEEKPPKPINVLVDAEPKIVVIMAGDDKPTYLATPATSSSVCSCHLQL